jgi:hypothetical protein
LLNVGMGDRTNVLDRVAGPQCLRDWLQASFLKRAANGGCITQLINVTDEHFHTVSLAGEREHA